MNSVLIPLIQLNGIYMIYQLPRIKKLGILKGYTTAAPK